MKNYARGTIVVPWDFSPMSESALRSAVELVDSPDQIKVIHVTPYPSVLEYGIIWGTLTEQDIQTNLEKSFREEMAKSPDIPAVKFITQFGDPGTQIVEFAKENHASLIVISSHGASGITRLFLGSVAERVVRLAHCPVLVLRGDSEE